jgi:hypothetical protein
VEHKLRTAVCKIGGRGRHKVELRAKSIGVLSGKEGCYRGPRVQFGSRKGSGETSYRREQGSVQRYASVRTPKDVGTVSGHAASPTI